jgi:hypothetical protein
MLDGVENEEIVTTMDTNPSHHFDVLDVAETNSSLPDITNIPEKSQTESCSSSVIQHNETEASATHNPSQTNTDNPSRTQIDNPSENMIETSSPAESRPENYVTDVVKNNIVTIPSQKHIPSTCSSISNSNPSTNPLFLSSDVFIDEKNTERTVELECGTESSLPEISEIAIRTAEAGSQNQDEVTVTPTAYEKPSSHQLETNDKTKGGSYGDR